jgi:hypothetical protein
VHWRDSTGALGDRPRQNPGPRLRYESYSTREVALVELSGVGWSPGALHLASWPLVMSVSD